MDISRRKMFGLMAGAAGGAGLAGCATTGKVNGTLLSELLTDNTVSVSFDHGVASGDAIQDSVILWTRVTPAKETSGSITVSAFYSTDKASVETMAAGGEASGPSEVLFSHFQTSADRDFTVKIDAAGLQPDSVYYYAFAVKTPDGVTVSPVGKTRTLPVTGGDKLVMGVVSCSNWPFGFFNVYKALSERTDLDAIMHLGDYIYEYGADGYGGSVGAKIGRVVAPATEIVTLDDYRTRHKLYKSDPNLQAAHAICPWYCTWDDHESANDSYRTGAQNHNPENNEGSWTDRKQVAVQAYLEWMPVRDPEPGRAKESIYRTADFGDLATFFMLESRLTGRSDEISWGNELIGVAEADLPAKVMATVQKYSDPSRTMLGKVQEDWLDKGLKASAGAGKTWQVLVNQVILAKAVPPDFAAKLKPEQLTKLPDGYAQLLVALAQMKLPFNLDAWDGFPAARERLFASAKEAGARLVTLTGDTHTAWANTPHAKDGTQMGVEFGCTSVTSPGMGAYIPLENLGDLLAEANDDVTWYDPFGHGYTLVTLTPEKAIADYFKVSTILEETFETEKVASFEASKEETGVSPLTKV